MSNRGGNVGSIVRALGALLVVTMSLVRPTFALATETESPSASARLPFEKVTLSN